VEPARGRRCCLRRRPEIDPSLEEAKTGLEKIYHH
jgi:hypothetical protein